LRANQDNNDFGYQEDTHRVAVRDNNNREIVNPTISFTYLREIALTKTSDLDFGKIALDPTQDSTIRLNPGGTIQVITGAAETVSGSSVAAFSVTGSENYAVDVVLPVDGVVFMTGPGDPIVLNNFMDNAPSTFNGLGAMDFNVGADVVIDQNQIPGSYVGAFNVEVNYQ
jgi:hypothetical protein